MAGNGLVSGAPNFYQKKIEYIWTINLLHSLLSLLSQIRETRLNQIDNSFL